MYILVTYDVETKTREGQRRLRRIAQICLNYGQRVQNSVFECKLDATEYVTIKHELLQAYDPDKDSIRIYRLGKNYDKSVEHYGTKVSYRIDKPLVL